MRILFVSTNNEHSNTTYANFVRGLVEVSDITFYGPGFSTEEELKGGLKYFCKDKQFDAVVLSFFFAKYRSEYLEIRYMYSEYHYIWSDFSIIDAIRYIDPIVEDISDMDITKAVLYVDDVFDMHESWNANLRDLISRGMYVIAPGEQFIPKFDEQDLKSGRFGANNRYRTFVKDNRDVIISMIVYAVSYDEFFWQPLEKRKYEWVVPGNINEIMYPKRGEMIRKIEASGRSIFGDFTNRSIHLKEDKRRVDNSVYENEADRYIDMRLNRYSPYLSGWIAREKTAMWRERYNRSLRQSRVGYADGSFARCIVKKYFEIPARGTVLVCDEIPPLTVLGFYDGENMILGQDDSVNYVNEMLSNNIEYLQEIANKSRQLVLEKHTSKQRAQDTVKALECILEKKYKGSFWENGSFKLITQ